MHKSYLIPWLLMASFTIHSMAQVRARRPRSKTFPQETASRWNCSTPCPRKSLNFWVNLCVDDKNRSLQAISSRALPVSRTRDRKELDQSKIEKIPADIRAANGLLWAFDALYCGQRLRKRWKAGYTN